MVASEAIGPIDCACGKAFIWASDRGIEVQCHGCNRKVVVPFKSLTGREIEVLELVARGLRNHQIAATLRITEETVQVHVRNILDKLEVEDRTAAATVALRRGIIRLS